MIPLYKPYMPDLPEGEKLYETLLTKEEKVTSQDMGDYFKVTPNGRRLNNDRFLVIYGAITEAGDVYTSNNTNRLNMEETVKKILTIEYVKEELKKQEGERRP